MAVLLGLGQAVYARNALFGWDSEAWSIAWLEALEIARQSLPPGKQTQHQQRDD